MSHKLWMMIFSFVWFSSFLGLAEEATNRFSMPNLKIVLEQLKKVPGTNPDSVQDMELLLDYWRRTPFRQQCQMLIAEILAGNQSSPVLMIETGANGSGIYRVILVTDKQIVYLSKGKEKLELKSTKSIEPQLLKEIRAAGSQKKWLVSNAQIAGCDYPTHFITYWRSPGQPESIAVYGLIDAIAGISHEDHPAYAEFVEKYSPLVAIIRKIDGIFGRRRKQ